MRNSNLEENEERRRRITISESICTDREIQNAGKNNNSQAAEVEYEIQFTKFEKKIKVRSTTTKNEQSLESKSQNLCELKEKFKRRKKTKAEFKCVQEQQR